MSQTVSAAPHSGEVVLIGEKLPTTPSLSVEAEKLALRIERAVRRSTNDKIRDLKVVINRDGIFLNGHCGTYYCKQLAQTAAMAIVAKEETLLNRIEVW